MIAICPTGPQPQTAMVSAGLMSLLRPVDHRRDLDVQAATAAERDSSVAFGVGRVHVGDIVDRTVAGSAPGDEGAAARGDHRPRNGAPADPLTDPIDRTRRSAQCRRPSFDLRNVEF
jgi:hypothetical protein